MSDRRLDVQQALACARITVTLYGDRAPRRLIEHLENLERTASSGASATNNKVRQQEWNLIGTAEAARILGCSTAYVRRIATDLDGHRISKNAWHFNRKAVQDYAQSRNDHKRAG